MATNRTLPRGNSTSTAVSATGVPRGVTSFNGMVGAVETSSIPSGDILLSQIQPISADTLLGNPTGSPVSPSEITIGATLSFSGSALETNALTGDVTTSADSFATTIANDAVTTSKIINGAVTEAKITLADNTTNNVSTSKHGFTPKLSGSASSYLDGTGAYSTPAGTGVSSISISSANGFAGSSSGGATPALTLSTTITGIVKGNGTALSAASAGSDYCAATSGSSVLKGSSGNTTAATAGTDYMKPDTTSNLTAGFSATSYNAGTQTTGTFTPAPANGNLQYAVNGGAFTLAPPSSDCCICLQITNNGSAGAITTSGFTIVNGAFTTTNGDDFFAYITKLNGFSFLNIAALQ